MQLSQSSVENFASACAGDIEAKVQLLLDRSEIADIVRRYAQSIDTRDSICSAPATLTKSRWIAHATRSMNRLKWSASSTPSSTVRSIFSYLKASM